MPCELGSHSSLAFSASKAVEHLVKGDVLGSGKRSDLVAHRF
jgi:hypothetical protein